MLSSFGENLGILPGSRVFRENKGGTVIETCKAAKQQAALAFLSLSLFHFLFISSPSFSSSKLLPALSYILSALETTDQHIGEKKIGLELNCFVLEHVVCRRLSRRETLCN